MRYPSRLLSAGSVPITPNSIEDNIAVLSGQIRSDAVSQANCSESSCSSSLGPERVTFIRLDLSTQMETVTKGDKMLARLIV